MIPQIAFSLLLFLIPLASGPLFTNQDIPKFFLVTLMALGAGFCFFRSFRKEKSLKVSLCPVDALWFVFFFLLLLSLGKAMYWHNAWERMSQWLILLFLHAFCRFWSNERLGKNIRILFYSGVVAALYGICQSLDAEYIRTYPAYVSTFGNINLAASVIAILLLLAFALPKTGKIFAVIQWIGWGILFFYLIRTGCRAAWLAFGFGIAGYILLFVFSKDRFSWKKLLILAMIGCFFVAIPFAFDSIRTKFLLRFQEIGNWDVGSGKVRYWMWQSTGEMIWKNPCLGSGLGHFSFHYPRYRAEEEYLLSQGRLVDHPHNDFLWIACEMGIPAAFCFMGIVLFTFCGLFSLLKSQEEHKRKESRTLIVVLAGFLILGLFSFPMASASCFWIFPMITGYVDFKSKVFFIPKRPFFLAYCITAMFLFVGAFLALFANIFFMAGQKNLLARQYQEAEKSFQIAVDFYPSGSYFVEWGRSLLALREYERAEKVFLRTVEIRPDLENAAIDLGLVYFMKGDKQHALDTWEKARDIFPLSMILHYNIVRFFWQTNQEQKALKYLEDLPSKNNKLLQDGNYMLYMGEAYQRTGNLRKAFSCYIQAKEITKDQGLPYLKIGLLMEELSLYDSAVYHLSQALDLGNKEEKISASFALGKIHEKEKKWQNAALYYLRAKQENPKNPRVYLHIAQISLHLGKEEYARKNLENAKASGFKDWEALEKEKFFYPLISSKIYENFKKF